MSVVNGRLITEQGAPASLIFNTLASMLDSTKLENRIQPYGQSIFNTSGQLIRFVIPKTDRAFANFQNGYVTGQVDVSGLAAGAGTDMYTILGSYYSLFSRQVISSNGKPLETIERPGELVNMLMNMTLNSAEKKAMSNNFGFANDIIVAANTYEGDVTLNICQLINTATAGASAVLLPNNGRTFTFALPLIGLLNCAKQIALVNGDITIELTMNTVSNYLVGNTILAMAPILAGTVTVALSNMEFVYDQLTLSPQSYAMVMHAYPEKIYIKSESYDFGTGPVIAAGFSGSVDIPVNQKRSSLKSVFMYFNQSDLIDKSFGGINPNGTDLVFISNGTQYPQRPIKLSNPSECYNQIQKTFGSLYSNNHGGSCGKLEFCRRSTTTGSSLFYPAAVLPTPATDVGFNQILSLANKFYVAIDTEILNYDSESLYSGVQMGVNSNFRLNIASPTATGQSITPYYWLCYDSIIEMDLINGITSTIC